jgi:hypothetical protein
LISRYNCTFSSEGKFLAEDARNTDRESGEEESSQDGKREDPLEFVSFEEELFNTERRNQDAECKTNSVVLRFVSECYEGWRSED